MRRRCELRKNERLTGYLSSCSIKSEGTCTITRRATRPRGSQLSLRLKGNPKVLLRDLGEQGVICDFREPDIIRVAPTALYNTFTDVHRFVAILGEHAC